jgi:hypothetical protein
MQRYTIVVKTGDRFGAGTNANVHLKLFGDKGDSPIQVRFRCSSVCVCSDNSFVDVSQTLNNARDNFERNKVTHNTFFSCVVASREKNSRCLIGRYV